MHTTATRLSTRATTAFRVTVLALLALLAIALTTTASAKETVTQEMNKTFRLQPGGEVTLENVNGAIQVEGWDRDRVELHVVKKVQASSLERAEEAMRNFEVLIESTPEMLRVETNKPKGEGGLVSWLRSASTQYQASYELRVPRHVIIDANTVNGRVTLTDLNGDVDADTTNGSIHMNRVSGRTSASTTNGSIQVAEARGSVSASTTNGRIRVSLMDVTPTADMSFSTTNGSVELELPADVQTHLEARTTNGGISTDFAVKVDGKRGSKSIDAAINGGGDSRLKVRTTNGGIRIREI